MVPMRWHPASGDPTGRFEMEPSAAPTFYYHRDRDHANRTIYVLVQNGQRVGTAKTKAEAERWHRERTGGAR